MADEKKVKTFHSGPGGALLCSEEIPGVTQTLDDQTAEYYGGRYFVGETITAGAAKIISELFAGVYES